jgi:type I restriction enzyme S subunit
MMSKLNNIPQLRFKGFEGEWKHMKLGQVCDKIQDGNYGGEYPKADEFVEKGIPFLTSKALGGDGFLKEDKIDFIPIEKHNKLKKAQLKLNDVLFTNRGSNVGSIGFTDMRIAHGNIGPQLTLLRSDLKTIIPLFLYQIMKSEITVKQIRSQDSGSAMNFFGINTTSKFKLSIPSLPEQQKIASFLTAVDDKLQALKQKLTLLEQYKKGVMQKIFAQELRFKPSPIEALEIGDEYPDWEEKKLGEVASFRRGSFPQPYGLPEWYDNQNGQPFIQVFDVDENMLLKPNTKNKISDLAIKQSVFVKKGTIVITIQGSIGRIAKTQYDAYIDRTLLIFQSYKVPINIDYFKYVLFLLFEIEKTKAPGGTIKTITKEVLTDFKVLIPILPEQTKIASFLSAIDEKIEKTTQQLTQTETFKKGLLQKMFV